MFFTKVKFIDLFKIETKVILLLPDSNFRNSLKNKINKI